jgi:hypothetical protein
VVDDELGFVIEKRFDSPLRDLEQLPTCQARPSAHVRSLPFDILAGKLRDLANIPINRMGYVLQSLGR